MQQFVNRRSIFAGAAAAGTLAATAAIAGSTSPPTKKRTSASTAGHDDHHDHMGHGGHGGGVFELTGAEKRVVSALADCQTAGEVCLSQCIEVLATGDTSMADCARAVRAMLAVCRAAKTLVESHSTFAGQQLALCRDACNACQSECVKHSKHHVTCSDCADACETAMKAIDRLMG